MVDEMHDNSKKIRLMDDDLVEEMQVDADKPSTVQNGPVLPTELLEMILKDLRTKDLLKIRFVNSWMGVLAFKLLVQRPEIKITLSGSCPKSLIRLRLFNKCLGNAKKMNRLDKFPCSRFEIDNADLAEIEVQEFLCIYGNFVKSLYLLNCHSREDAVALTALHRLLVTQASNIKDLRIMNYHFPRGQQVKPTLFGDSGTKLPQLEILNFSRNVATKLIGVEILGAAVNLKLFEGFGHYMSLDVEEVVLRDHSDAIKEAKIRLSEGSIDFYEKFAETRPELVDLKLSLGQLYANTLLVRVADVISQILSSSEDTLETISEFQPVGHLDVVDFSYCETLKELRLCAMDKSVGDDGNWSNSVVLTQRMFQVGFDLRRTFPNLQTLILDLEGIDSLCELSWQQYFPFADVIPSVENLTVIGGCDPKFLRRLSLLLINVKHLMLSEITDLPSTCIEIWKYWRNLESLELLDIFVNTVENRQPAIDSAFTGFSLEACDRLTVGEEGFYRIRGWSILGLTALKSLRIKFHHGHGWEKEELWERPFLTRLSGQTFQLLPHLKVTVLAKVYSSDNAKQYATRAFEEIAPFVRSTHVNF